MKTGAFYFIVKMAPADHRPPKYKWDVEVSRRQPTPFHTTLIGVCGSIEKFGHITMFEIIRMCLVFSTKFVYKFNKTRK